MSFNPKQFDEIIQNMIDWVVAHTSKISDFNEGSINRAILGAVATVVEEGYFDIMLGWKDSLRYALQTSLNFERVGGSSGGGNVIFSRATAASQTYSIPVGTTIATPDGIRFVTTVAGQISIGNTSSASLAVASEVAGANSNVDANTITVLVSSPAGVETVDNAAATTGGIDEESDDAYDERFRLYLQGLTKTTGAGLRAGVLSVSGVQNVHVFEDTVQPGFVTIYVADPSGIASIALLEDVEDLLEGDGTEANPGYRPAGIVYYYISATKIDASVTATVYYDAGADEDALEIAVGSAISDYINSLEIGADIVVSKLVDIAHNVVGVRDFVVSIPAANVGIDADAGEIAKYLTGNYTMTQYTDLP